MGERLRVLIRNYAELKFADPEKLRSLLDPLPMRVEMMSLHGGKDFIKTLNATESYYYSMLLYDIVKASLGVQSCLREPLLHASNLQLEEFPSQQIQPVGHLESTSVPANENSSSAVVIRNPENSSVPNPFQFETLRSQSTPLQSGPCLITGTIGNRETITTPLQNASTLQGSRDVSLFGNVPEIPQQSTPLQPGLFPLPPLPMDRSPIVSLPTIRHNVPSPSLPVLREHEVESHVSVRNPVEGGQQQQVVHSISRQRISTDRREPEQLLQNFDVRALPQNHEFLFEMAEMTVDHRRREPERNRRQSRRMRLPEMPTAQEPLPTLVIKRAEQVICYDNYLTPTFHTRRNILETYLELATASIDLQQNVYYRVSASVDEMRRDQSRDNTSSFPRPVQGSEVSTSTDRMIPIEIIPEVSNEAQPEILLSPPPQPIMVPDFVEHLIDTEPIRSPVHLRPRHETPRDLMISRTTGPSRRRRRRRRRQNAGEQNPAEGIPTHQPEPTLADFIQQEPIAITAQSPLRIRTRSQVRCSRSRRTYANVHNNDFRRKFQIWFHALSENTASGSYGHVNRLAEIRKIEDIYKETGAVLRAISTEQFTPLQTVIPSSVVRTAAVKRIAILLELNTRGLIKLKTNASRITTGVENTAIADIPVTN